MVWKVDAERIRLSCLTEHIWLIDPESKLESQVKWWLMDFHLVGFDSLNDEYVNKSVSKEYFFHIGEK